VTADERQAAATERPERAGRATYSPPALIRLAPASEAASSGVGGEAWLRDLLAACHRALHDLRQTGSAAAQAPITDLEQLCVMVQRHLDGPARAEDVSPAR